MAEVFGIRKGGHSEHVVWIAGWALAAAILIVGSGAAALNQDFSEPDNAMRLVRVRDLIAGQGWFDSVELRLNPPDGTPMHWARWIDAVLALPIMALSPIVGQHNAEVFTAFLWPLGLLAAFMVLTVKVAGEVGSRDNLRREAQWAGAILAALAFPAIEKFAPGFFDHHNVELVLGMGAVLGLIRMDRTPSGGMWAGLCLGLAMATAAEAVPMVAAGVLAAGLAWLFQPQVFGRGLLLFGLGLAASSLALFATTVPAHDWNRPVCDAMSTPFLGLGLSAGAVAMVLGGGSPTSLTSNLVRRFILAGILSLSSVIALIVLFPGCLGGGYAAMSAEMKQLWMAQISETRSLGDLLADNPGMLLTTAGAAAAGLVAAVFYQRRRWRDHEGWVVLAFLLLSWAVLAWQIRGATFATAFAIPFGAWFVAKARRDYRSKTSAIRLAAFAGIAASSAAAAWASAGNALQAQVTPKAVLADYQARVESSEDCATPAAFRALNAAPKGVMLNQFTIGANVLAWTEHSVLAGPYHRDVEGTMTMIQAMRTSPDKARAIITHTSADYVLICPGLPETRFYASHAADGVAPEQTLSWQLGHDTHPDWLAPVTIDGPLRLYRITR
jgi:hypothetical protein